MIDYGVSSLFIAKNLRSIDDFAMSLIISHIFVEPTLFELFHTDTRYVRGVYMLIALSLKR